jgi:lipid-A-disaccharide synthase
MLAAVDRLAAGPAGARARLIAAPGLAIERLTALLGARAGRVEVVTADRHRALAGCGAAMVASGTATLECALLGVPMVVGYRLHALTYALARALVEVPFVSLVNLTAGERVVTELVQHAFTAEALAAEVERLLGPDGVGVRERLAEVRRRLGAPGASERAARAVVAETTRR